MILYFQRKKLRTTHTSKADPNFEDMTWMWPISHTITWLKQMGGESQGAIWTPCGKHLAKDFMTASVWGYGETMLCLNLSSLSWLCRQVTISQWDSCWNNCAISCSPAEQVWWYFQLVLSAWFLEQRLGKGKVIMGFQSELHLCTNNHSSACS